MRLQTLWGGAVGRRALLPPRAPCDLRHVPQVWQGWSSGCRQQRCRAFKVFAQAAKKQGKPKSGKGPAPSKKKPGIDFEDLMLLWDDVFEDCCKVSSKAQSMEAMAARGYEQHGRGFLFVKSKVKSQSKRAAGKGPKEHKGFGGAPPPAPAGAPLECNPALLEQSWSAAYIPAHYLPSLGGILSGAGGVPVPEPSQLLGTQEGSGSGSSGSGSSQATDPASSAGSAGGADVDDAMLEELRRAVRGMDAGSLAMMVGCDLPGPYGRQAQHGGEQGDGEQAASSSSSDSEQAGTREQRQEQEEDQEEEEEEQQIVGVERPYQPEAREFVVLLLAFVDQQPAIGADIVMAVGDTEPGGSTQLVMVALQDVAFA